MYGEERVMMLMMMSILIIHVIKFPNLMKSSSYKYYNVKLTDNELQ